MRRRKTLMLAVILLCGLVLVGSVTAMESDSFAINWDVLGGGGSPSASDNFAVVGTIGQGVIGLKSSDSFDACTGFWCGAAVEYDLFLPLVLRTYS